MTEYDGDPFAGANEDEDEFATATNVFLDIKDLDERLVIFDVISSGTKPGKRGGTYDYVVANVVVLDGDPIEPHISTIPGVGMDMHINATGVVPQLLKHLKTNPGKPFLARLDSVPSRDNPNTKVMGVRKHVMTDADKAAARGPWRQYKSEVPF